jgi:hypothetical protein
MILFQITFSGCDMENVLPFCIGHLFIYSQLNPIIFIQIEYGDLFENQRRTRPSWLML